MIILLFEVILTSQPWSASGCLVAQAKPSLRVTCCSGWDCSCQGWSRGCTTCNPSSWSRSSLGSLAPRRRRWSTICPRATLPRPLESSTSKVWLSPLQRKAHLGCIRYLLQVRLVMVVVWIFPRWTNSWKSCRVQDPRRKINSICWLGSPGDQSLDEGVVARRFSILSLSVWNVPGCPARVTRWPNSGWRSEGYFLRLATVNDLKMFVRIMKGDLKIQVSYCNCPNFMPKSAFQGYDEIAHILGRCKTHPRWCPPWCLRGF